MNDARTVKRLLEDRRRLIEALSDTVARLALDRTDTRALGFPATREERNGRALLVRLARLSSHATASGVAETAAAMRVFRKTQARAAEEKNEEEQSDPQIVQREEEGRGEEAEKRDAARASAVPENRGEHFDDHTLNLVPKSSLVKIIVACHGGLLPTIPPPRRRGRGLAPAPGPVPAEFFQKRRPLE